VQFFDGVLLSYVSGQSSLCVLGRSAARGSRWSTTATSNSCDHYVEPRFTGSGHPPDPSGVAGECRPSVSSAGPVRRAPGTCRECRYLFTCHGDARRTAC